MPDESSDSTAKPRYAAHTPPKGHLQPWQSMLDHAQGVAGCAEKFGKDISPAASALAGWCGWAHDAGKYSAEFQGYLERCAFADRAGAKAPQAGQVDHKTAGAKLALDTLPTPLDFVAAHCILGHHGGLTGGLLDGLKAIVKGNIDRTDYLASSLPLCLADLPLEEAKSRLPSDPLSILAPGAKGMEWMLACEMLIRFVFSCLVDADSLDTERHTEPDKASLRPRAELGDAVVEWIAALDARVAELAAGQEADGGVRRVRAEVYAACRLAAAESPGVFTLAVPTGGGKTLSSLAFALEHARVHGLSRVIYVIPYTSIIDQTAREFRRALPGGAWVLEHHSAVEPPRVTAVTSDDKDAAADEAEGGEQTAEAQRRLAAENWDAPLIVTTSVQFFESLFTNRTSRARKLHNIARSVIILDEAQTMPATLLTALVSGLGTLTRDLGASVVLCTATQPAVTGQSEIVPGLAGARPIIDAEATERHFAEMKRVTFRVAPEKWSWQKLAEEVAGSPCSCIVVLNTKKDALAALEAIQAKEPDAEVYYLSTLLCGAHRKAVIDAVTDALAAERSGGKAKIRLVTTQIVECGVDLDAHRVFRARGPLDRIIQAAGRCNRSKLRPAADSEVVIFDPAEGGRPRGTYQIECDAAEAFLSEYLGERDLADPDVPVDYFRLLYRRMESSGLDQKGVQKLRASFNYPEVAQQVRLIEDDTVPVLCRYDEEAERLAGVVAGRTRRGLGLTRDLWRFLQPYTVAVRRSDVAGLLTEGKLAALVPDALFEWIAAYDALLGIGGAGGVVRDPMDLTV